MENIKKRFTDFKLRYESQTKTIQPEKIPRKKYKFDFCGLLETDIDFLKGWDGRILVPQKDQEGMIEINKGKEGNLS